MSQAYPLKHGLEHFILLFEGMEKHGKSLPVKNPIRHPLLPLKRKIPLVSKGDGTLRAGWRSSEFSHMPACLLFASLRLSSGRKEGSWGMQAATAFLAHAFLPCYFGGGGWELPGEETGTLPSPKPSLLRRWGNIPISPSIFIF